MAGTELLLPLTESHFKSLEYTGYLNIDTSKGRGAVCFFHTKTCRTSPPAMCLLPKQLYTVCSHLQRVRKEECSAIQLAREARGFGLADDAPRRPRPEGILPAGPAQ
ncbi:hypothetical protein VTK73DRAFT_1098 [Phialemonium thermophilum]|uniref:Uncharacterized protein n=1 Tax=Phialemonium thermophilum TaxID=223376 RepID=A0ABR3VU11_9PEZI